MSALLINAMDTLVKNIWENRIRFFSTFFVVFTLSYLMLMAFDFLPEKPAKHQEGNQDAESILETTASSTESILDSELDEQLSEGSLLEATAPELDRETESKSNQTSEASAAAHALPVRISINRLGKDVPVLNPTSRSIADLDDALLSGVVRHPDSATLLEDGNLFILGHSSYLPKVFNKNFQAFNGIQNLEWGDIIVVYSDSSEYEYRVEKVYRARAQDVTVPIAGTGKMLTLATCNSFGSVDDRYIVEAMLVESRVSGT